MCVSLSLSVSLSLCVCLFVCVSVFLCLSLFLSVSVSLCLSLSLLTFCLSLNFDFFHKSGAWLQGQFLDCTDWQQHNRHDVRHTRLLFQTTSCSENRCSVRILMYSWHAVVYLQMLAMSVCLCLSVSLCICLSLSVSLSVSVCVCLYVCVVCVSEESGV